MQWVRTQRTKRSRGGPRATVRNATPITFPLPDFPAPYVHRVIMREDDGFQPHESTRPLVVSAPRTTVEDVSLHASDGTLLVKPVICPMFGIPPRPRRPPAVPLAPGQWIRWQLNYRFSSAAGMADWSYWLDTRNLAYGNVDRDTFLGTPDRQVDERGYLR